MCTQISLSRAEPNRALTVSCGAFDPCHFVSFRRKDAGSGDSESQTYAIGFGKCLLIKYIEAMGLVKTCAVVLVLALFLQSGCDLWCQHAKEIASAIQPQGTPVPPCHDAESDPKDSSNHETPKDCVHPQAVDGNSKLQTEGVKASQPVAIVEVADIQSNFQFHAVASQAIVLDHILPPGPPSSILRI